MEAAAAEQPRPRRSYGVPLLLGGMLVAAALAGIAVFYLGLDHSAGVREASVSAPLPQAAPSQPAKPPPAPAAATASPPPAPPAAAPPEAQVAAAVPSTTASTQPPAATTAPGGTASSSGAGTSETTETAAAAGADISMGDALGAFRLGVRYAFGDGVAQDYQKAAEQFRIAAQQGLPDAQYNLGALYDNGLGVPRDPVRAVIWYHSAAEAGHPSAQLNLGLAYANGSGVAQDYGEAARWFRRAADQGIVTAQYNLAALYANGKGLAPSLGDAYAWFSIAAASGDTEAQHQMQRIASALSPKQLRDAKALAASLSQQIGHTTDPQLHGSVLAPEGASEPPHDPGATTTSAPVKASTPPPDRAVLSEIQRDLIHLHYDPGRSDGVMSDKTTDAIRKYQADRKLNVDGEPTRVLLFRLKAEVQQQAKQ
jgi:localization factor PodJL